VGLWILGIRKKSLVVLQRGWLTHLTAGLLRDAGVGRHFFTIPMDDPQELVAWANSTYALQWLYLSSAALPKISILLFYLRVFIS